MYDCFQLDLMSLHYVESVVIYPRMVHNQFVSELQISVSNDSFKWLWVTENDIQGVPEADAQVRHPSNKITVLL